MKFHLHGYLRRFVEPSSVVEISAATLGQSLQELVTKYPSLRPVLYDNADKLRLCCLISIDGEQASPQDLGLALRDTDSVQLQIAVAGG